MANFQRYSNAGSASGAKTAETANVGVAESGSDAARFAADAAGVTETFDTSEPEEPVSIDYGRSYLFTEREMDHAIALILDEFDTWDGCEMHSIRYAGDECNSRRNVRWLNSLDGGRRFTECIAFLSDFHSPVEGGGAWEPDYEYTDWQWWLARTEDGEWELVSWGY